MCNFNLTLPNKGLLGPLLHAGVAKADSFTMKILRKKSVEKVLNLHKKMVSLLLIQIVRLNINESKL